MRVLITGTSAGIGQSTAKTFLNNGHRVIGLDIAPCTIFHSNYTHVVADVSDTLNLPEVLDVDILINNAGVQNSGRDIEVNLIGTINCTNKYGIRPGIKSIVNVASISAHNGAEFPEYAASKGGVLTYTKNVAMDVAKYGATCNSISPGGVITPINQHILDNEELYQAVLNESMLGKWASADEIAEWIYFISVVNKSMTGQDIIIDNGELAKFNFIW